MTQTTHPRPHVPPAPLTRTTDADTTPPVIRALRGDDPITVLHLGTVVDRHPSALRRADAVWLGGSDLTAVALGTTVIVRHPTHGIGVTSVTQLQGGRPVVPTPAAQLPAADMETVLTGIRRLLDRRERHPEDTAHDDALGVLIGVACGGDMPASQVAGLFAPGDSYRHSVEHALQQTLVPRGAPYWQMRVARLPRAVIAANHPGLRTITPDLITINHVEMMTSAVALWGQELVPLSLRLHRRPSMLSEGSELDIVLSNASLEIALVGHQPSNHSAMLGSSVQDVEEMLRVLARSVGVTLDDTRLTQLRTLAGGPLQPGALLDLERGLAAATRALSGDRHRTLGPAVHRALDADVSRPGEDTWRFRRARTQGELQDRGELHHHCVGSAGYGGRAAAGEIDLVLAWRGEEATLTLEIENGRVVQALGPYNRDVRPDERAPLVAWATHAGVTLLRSSTDHAAWTVTAVEVEAISADGEDSEDDQTDTREDTPEGPEIRRLCRAVLGRIDREARASAALLARKRSQLARRVRAGDASLGW